MNTPSQEKEYVKDEIRKEFQLERMILFSDAVFAIVITLMAIEIHVPDNIRFDSDEELRKTLLHLLPNMIAYTVSFIFIGFTWYQHLQLFSLLKDYNKGLVVRNLALLFFIGLFPFCASLIARPSHGTFIAVIIYFSIIVICRTTQLMLQHYILVKSPHLRIRSDIHDEMISFKKSRIVVVLLVIMFTGMSITSYFIDDPDQRAFAWFWFFPFPLIIRYVKKRMR